MSPVRKKQKPADQPDTAKKSYELVFSNFIQNLNKCVYNHHKTRRWAGGQRADSTGTTLRQDASIARRAFIYRTKKSVAKKYIKAQHRQKTPRRDKTRRHGTAGMIQQRLQHSYNSSQGGQSQRKTTQCTCRTSLRNAQAVLVTAAVPTAVSSNQYDNNSNCCIIRSR